MRLAEIKPGGKYWKKLTGRKCHCGAIEVKAVIYSPVRVLAVDMDKRQVTASIDGNPAQVYDRSAYNSWKQKEEV